MSSAFSSLLPLSAPNTSNLSVCAYCILICYHFAPCQNVTCYYTRIHAQPNLAILPPSLSLLLPPDLIWSFCLLPLSVVSVFPFQIPFVNKHRNLAFDCFSVCVIVSKYQSSTTPALQANTIFSSKYLPPSLPQNYSVKRVALNISTLPLPSSLFIFAFFIFAR